MKMFILILLGTFNWTMVLSQEVKDNLKNEVGHLVAYKKGNDIKPQTFSVGEVVAIRQKDKSLQRGKISEVHHDHILVGSETEIQIANIKWIRKSKPKTGELIGGLVLVGGGIALLAHVASGDVNFDEIAPLGVGGIGLIIAGIAIIPQTKFKLLKGDQLVYESVPK